MPIEVYWDDPAHTILITAYRDCSTEVEFFPAVDQGVSLAATSSAPRLDSINTLLNSGKLRVLPGTCFAWRVMPARACLRTSAW